jgi:hypothetical protein
VQGKPGGLLRLRGAVQTHPPRQEEPLHSGVQPGRGGVRQQDGRLPEGQAEGNRQQTGKHRCREPRIDQRDRALRQIGEDCRSKGVLRPGEEQIRRYSIKDQGRCQQIGGLTAHFFEGLLEAKGGVGRQAADNDGGPRG